MKKSHRILCLLLAALMFIPAMAEQCQHLNVTDEYVSDGNSHWQVCPDCHEALWEEGHYTICGEGDACLVCGRTDCDSIFVEHPYEYTNPCTDANYHWWECTSCGKVIRKEEHFTACVGDGLCYECGVPCEGSHEPMYDELQSDALYHWYPCANCDEEVYKEPHYGSCANPNVCAWCGAAFEGESDVTHNVDWDNPCFDEEYHWYECTDCHEKIDMGYHYTVCSNPGFCSRCGMEYDGEIGHIVYDDCIRYNETEHWYECPDCHEELYKAEHYGTCSNPNVCAECGAACSGGTVTHNFDVEDICYDDTAHWFKCRDCGESVSKSTHLAFCTNPGVCLTCGFTSSEIPLIHNIDYANNASSDDTYHWYVCLDCHEEVMKEEHFALCTAPGVCLGCGVECDNVLHTHIVVDPAVAATETETGLTEGSHCEDCGAVIVAQEVVEKLAHTHKYSGAVVIVEPTCEEDGYSRATCTVCGKIRDTVLPATGHSYVEKSRVEPTCEEEGLLTEVCENCEAELETILAPIGHSYRDVFVCLNNGTHGAPCLNEDCTQYDTKPCEMETNIYGNVKIDSCSICGYTVTTMLEMEDDASSNAFTETLRGNIDKVVEQIMAALPEGIPAERAQDVKISSAMLCEISLNQAGDTSEEGAETPAGTVVVYEQVVTSEFLTEDVSLHMYSIAAVSQGVAIELEEPITITLPVEEQDIEELSNLCLVMLLPDGTLQVIDFEIIDGNVVFEVDAVGMFAFVDPALLEVQ